MDSRHPDLVHGWGGYVDRFEDAAFDLGEPTRFFHEIVSLRPGGPPVLFEGVGGDEISDLHRHATAGGAQVAELGPGKFRVWK